MNHMINGIEINEWVDKALMGEENCPACDSELKDKWSAANQVSWLECENCDFNYIYEKG